MAIFLIVTKAYMVGAHLKVLLLTQGLKRVYQMFVILMQVHVHSW
jgi:hypothetical protein